MEQRIPPHSVEAEQSVLGSMLLDRDAVIAAIGTIAAEDFYIAANRMVFEAMAALNQTDSAVDMVTVVDKMEQLGTLEKAGGMEYLALLSRIVPTTANVEYYINIVKDRSTLRGVIQAGSQMVGSGFEANRPADEVIEQAHKSIYDLQMRGRQDSLRPMKEALSAASARVMSAMENNGKLMGVSTGFGELDRVTGGFEKGQMVVLAARPGRGKTSLALNIAHNVAVRNEQTVAIFSLEMSAEDLALRMMCAEAEVNLGDARRGQIRDEDTGRLIEAMRRLNNGKLYIDASGHASVPEIRARCMRLSAKEPLGLIVIDYLQLMQSTGGGRKESRQQEVSELTRSLKLLAGELQCPILVLSQLNRGVESANRRDRRPKLSDLRESGSIEQDADIVLFIAHKSDLEPPEDEEEEMDAVQNEAFLIVAKNRNGETRDIPMYWLGEYTKFKGASFRHE